MCMASSLIFEDKSFAADLAFLFSVSFIFFWLLRRTLCTDEDGDDKCELRQPPKRSRREQMYRAASRPTQDAERSGPDCALAHRHTSGGNAAVSGPEGAGAAAPSARSQRSIVCAGAAGPRTGGLCADRQSRTSAQLPRRTAAVQPPRASDSSRCRVDAERGFIRTGN